MSHPMSSRTKLLGLASLATLALACGPRVNWNYYAPFGVIGDKEPTVSPVDPAAVHHFGVASKLHYISVVVDGVFFRNLPKTQGREVAIGIDMSGGLPKDVKTVSEPVTAQGPNGMIFFDRPFAIDPFLYRGVPLRITVSFRDVGPSEATILRGRLQSLGMGVARKLVPGAEEKLKLHQTNFESFMGGPTNAGKVYSYTFSLYPSEMEGVRQDLVLTGGRHVFIGVPSPGSPAFIKKLKPADLAYKLRLAGRRLEWRHDGSEYQDSPYVILSVIRYKRYPSDETPLRTAAKSVDKMIEQQNWQLARSNLPNIGQALLEDKLITQQERNLEEAWRDVRLAKIELGEAAAKGDKEAQLQAMLKQLKLLGYIGKDFQQILEPYEVKDVRFQARRLGRQARELGKELGKPDETVAKVRDEALASIKVPPPPPPPRELKPPEVVKVVVVKPEPFYTRWWFYALVGVAAAAP
jgi:hypothetical protein